MSKMATKKVGFRQLARNHRESKKHIDSPLAKYNSTGQLLCVLCNIPIKSALLWDSHVFGKKHKQNLADLKNKSSKASYQAADTPHPPTVTSTKDDFAFVRPQTKRTNNEQIETPAELPEKKLKVDLDTTSISLTDKPGHSSPEKEVENNASGSKLSNTPSDLPADFFDSSQETKQDMESENPSESTEGIPEGFFDDPKQDAKVRNVEYKDPVEEEWEKFQKAMQMETQVSQSILEGEDEESRVDRELSELSEQRIYFLRADALRDKQGIIKEEVSKQAVLQKEMKEEHSSNSDDSDFEEFLDWRAKKAL